MQRQNRLADAVAELFGERHRMAGQHRDLQAVLAQGGSGFHGDETVADDHRPLTGLGAVQNLLRIRLGAQDEHLRQVRAGQLRSNGDTACRQQGGVVLQRLAVDQL
ncbi:hypothetical protein D3C76_1127920 [compost metagenome]